MIIKKENINEVLTIINERCEEYGIEDDFGVANMMTYNYALENMAKKSQYQEGQKISEDDLNDIKKRVNDIITHLASEIKKKEMIDLDKSNFNGLDTLTAATDYLYAVAMEKLGCPDIPASFGLDVCKKNQKHAKELDTKIKKSYLDKEYSTQTYFNNQREQDADVVRHRTKDLIRECGLQITAEQLANLVAEYQALNLRQKGHGRIWRFFHSGENDKRTQLLEDMEKAITKAVGEKVNLEPTEKTPSDIAILLNNKLIEKKAIGAAKPDEFASRYNITNMVKYEQSELEINISNKNKDNNLKENNKILDELTDKRKNINIDLNEVNDNNVLIEKNEPIEEVQVNKDKSNII